MKPALRIDLSAIRHNVTAWRRLAQSRPVWAVVKCDAYRMGMTQIAAAALEAGAERLCVIDVAEAQRLRDAGVTAPVVQVCATPAADLAAAVAVDVTVTLQDITTAQQLSAIAAAAGKTARAHVAVDSGSGWSGLLNDDVPNFAQAVRGLPYIEWEGAWTHIAGRSSMQAQLERFQAALTALRAHGLAVPTIHIASTGPALWGMQEGAVRVGIGLYGSAMGDGDRQHDLQTALEVSAPVFMVRRFPEPMPLGYGSAYTAQPGETIVTLRIGYGEGLPKTLSGTGHALLNGTLCPIVGNIGMNFTMVAAPPSILPQPGDQALLIGNAPGIRLDEVADAAQMIPHNVVTMLGSGIQPAYSGAAIAEHV